ncbi:MAG: hypothetical protein M3295_06430 [Chloroflexota bacterium]|nr:hypothetical protein [Chloroflexota bacterium]
MAPADALPYVNWLFWATLTGGTVGVVTATEVVGGTTRGYGVFMSWVVAVAAGVLVASALALPGAAARSLAIVLSVAIAVVCIVHLAATVVRLPRAALGAAASLGAVTAAAVIALTTVERAPAPLLVADVLVTALALGSVTAGMLLGHWYLVTPRLSPQPLRRMVWLLVASLTAEAALFALSLSMAPGDAVGVPFGWLTWLRLLAGTVLPLVVATLALLATRAVSLQATTGLLYVALALVAAGSIAGSSITYLTGVPV